jgi:hypothetical protein
MVNKKNKKKSNRSKLLAQITPKDAAVNKNMDLIFQVPGVPIRIRTPAEEALRDKKARQRAGKRYF